jgi:aryl-alcohol dehydrogenase-like predicted oxidoreductase
MERRPVPGTNLRLTELALGGWLTLGGSVPGAEAQRILHAALDAGINFIDLADSYARGGAEQVVGQFLRGRARDQVVVSSKVFWPMSDAPGDRGLGRGHVHRSIDRTLQRLGTDYLDLYFCHREDRTTPLLETAQAMHDLVVAGKVRAWGTSCWRPRTLRAVHRLCHERRLEPPRVEQPCYSLLDRDIEARLVPLCQELGMAIVVWSPLAGGVLTGKYNDEVPAGSRGAASRFVEQHLRPEVLARVRAFTALCAQRGLSPAAVALSWAAHQPGITSAITGATTAAHVRGNVAAASCVLAATLRAELHALFPPRRRPWWKRVLRQVLGRE